MASQSQESDVLPSSQPKPAGGGPESFSQPLLHQAERLLIKNQRARTGGNHGVYQFNPEVNHGLPDKEFETEARLRNGVYALIVERLKKRNITSSWLSEQGFAWCLPTSIHQETAWRLLFEDPLSVPTDLVDTLLQLELSTPDSPVPGSKATLFYIRSFTIRVRDLRRVLHELIRDGYDFNERAFLWLKTISTKDDKTYVTLRYCGQTKNRPWDRHASDIYSTSLSGFLGRFFKTVGKLCSEVLTNAIVQVVIQASTELGLHEQLLNLREQVLISLFGDGVLNLQAGGRDTTTFSDEDHAAFAKLRTDTVRLLEQHSKPCSEQVKTHIANYAMEVRKYVEANPSTRGGKKYIFDARVESMLLKQATPNVLLDQFAILVTVGSDIGSLHENHIVRFFEAGGRASNSVTACYNNFAFWERGFGHAFDAGVTQRLAKANYLPFVDMFPWFTKDADDYPVARKLLAKYIKITKPLILLSYGDIQTFALFHPVAKFTAAAFKSDQDRRQLKDHVEKVLGVPKLVAFEDDQGGQDTIVIPCFHPGRHGHIGILAEKGEQLFKMISAIGWLAITLVIQVSQIQPKLQRKALCLEVIKRIRANLDSKEGFGMAFMNAKREYLVAQKAFQQSSLLRKEAPDLPKPPKGILARKSVLTRKARSLAVDEVATNGVGGYEVLIQEQTIAGPAGDNVRETITWTEEDGKCWTLGPLNLPGNVAPSSDTDKRFLFFVTGGIDIRDHAGISVGVRQPVASGNTKAETLPLASIILTMSEKMDLDLFLSHWQDMTGINVDTVLGWPDIEDNKAEPFFPKSFFEASTSKRTLPFSTKALRAKDISGHLGAVRASLPANPGDLLWLLDRFLYEYASDGGELDLASRSEHLNSVYLSIFKFCSAATFKHHPHMRTLKAIVNIVEMGAVERMMATNALTFAFDILRDSFSKTSKTMVLKVDGKRRDSRRFLITVGPNTPEDTIAPWDEPDLELDVELLDDYYDDKKGKGKRKRDEVDDDGDRRDDSDAHEDEMDSMDDGAHY